MKIYSLGEWLDGGKNYKLVIPPNVPVRDFWAITTYDLETASYLRDIELSSVDSNMTELQRNTNGLLRQYFPKGMALSNVHQNRLNAVARRLNERPRETLNFETPAERFNQCVASTG